MIIIGTPPGVALSMKPTPQFLKAGDTVRLASTDWASSSKDREIQGVEHDPEKREPEFG